MAYPGVKLFMEKLKQMIYSNDIPQISNDPSVLSKRPQLQLLYEELGSMIQTLFVDTENDPHELEEVRNLKKRFKDVAEEAQDLVDLFAYDVNFKSKIQPLISHASETSLDLEDVMRSIKSIKEDFFSIIQKVRMESSPTTNSLKTQSAASVGTSCFRNSPVGDGIVVGLGRDIEIIRDKLTEDTRKLDVVSIVGMGGSGKTTLATKVFSDPFVVHHFWVRGWVTVSQKYERKDVLNRLLAYMGVDIDPDTRDNYPQLRKKLHQHLMGQRYLVVIDDIWSTQAWDDLKVVFPNLDNGSRILLTSRHKTVALHAKPHGFIHQLRSLTDEESLELLRKKVFRGDHFPDWSSLPGMQIARNCRGLPLSVVVIAGVLAKESATEESWERISKSGSSLILKGQMQTFALSLNHLPSHLRGCFIYLGCFPEDYTFRVTRLIWLWIAEGFIQETRNRSLEETAKDYLMELVDRNLIVVRCRKINGAIKTISVHDVLRELYLEVARKENSCLKVQGVDHSAIAPYKTRRIFTDCYIDTTNATRIQSLLNFYSYRNASYVISESSHSWKLLKVLDLKQCPMVPFPEEISLLVNLRYLAVRYDNDDFFQSRICDLWSLETLIIEGTSYNPLELPNTISDLVNLRILLCRRTIVFPPLQRPMMNLQTISNVALTKNWEKYFPNVKKLSCYIFLDTKYDFESLTFLETLKISSVRLQSCSVFPTSLKKLTLQGCHAPWSDISSIQSLPNLEVLKLLKNSFVGPMWDAGEEPFQQLKFLKLVGLDITKWEASDINFPCLKKLFLENCHLLEGIPLEMKYVPTLEHIQIKSCNRWVIESANEIRKKQHADGNFLMISADSRSIARYVSGGFKDRLTGDDYSIYKPSGLLTDTLTRLLQRITDAPTGGSVLHLVLHLDLRFFSFDSKERRVNHRATGRCGQGRLLDRPQMRGNPTFTRPKARQWNNR
ncbi:putative virus X resistance protein-like, coiled-coil [Helianthus annuus]|uniref:Virus X resistance protein-like, coiled-coil n=2 Tax=Helianthus annuus TaxID=4232 RepID=A0A9K3HHM2_HELAN|nr:putative late blight resistance protein homolog R1A-3 [Helianthus annuus]KAF5778530.1 putative virus X resistance protein-like, coiled-coil [Helianthus annuus]KAJ0493960.1 putative virus X resistance protein-like, coiled-coil [Helianthus annuus]KAJ0678797.1 putative virus X resistance protein-like, coiled-coil [Helianthus annuus]KAJ0863272.1 putative virus X resistance protein-like, coiled-coil [Helianthus annuus]